MLQDKTGDVLETFKFYPIEHMVRCNFLTINNEVKYEALIVRVKVEKVCGAHILLIKCDSQLVVNQVNGV